jgi:hypothetical protein
MDENPAILHSLPPEILDDRTLIISVNPLDITGDVNFTGDVSDDGVLVPVSKCTPDAKLWMVFPSIHASTI